MPESRDLLIEVGTEELPPKVLKRLSDAFALGLREGVEAAGLTHGGVHAYASPRRLGALLSQVSVAQPDRVKERRGPALTAAFDEVGMPTRAAIGFANSCGVSVEELDRSETDKGAWLVHRTWERGRETRDVIPEVLRQAIVQLPVPKRMRWADLEEEFVRPVHWLVVLFGEDVLPVQMFGLRASRHTFGHRFHHPAPLYLVEPAAYGPLLESEGHVIADFATRREAILAQVTEAAVALAGHAVVDDALLDEVTGLVEWPVAIAGDFDERFLDLPPEVVVAALKGHQKCFHVVDQVGRLLPHFITVSNIESRRTDVVRAGNERVIRPRLADAAFFWQRDRSHPLEDRYDALGAVVFEERLGTMKQRSERLQRLAGQVAQVCGWQRDLAERGARLCKCDLLSEMVGEFPELQGIMGRYYARHGGEPEEVARSIEEHYRPRFAGDKLPETPTGQALAVADRLDTLTGIFGIGEVPSGDKDPFGLRRAALGVLRIIIEKRLDLDLAELVRLSALEYSERLAQRASLPAEVFEFMMERLRAYYLEQGIRPDAFEAVQSLGTVTRPYDFDRRLRAVSAFRTLPEADSLAAANKRIRNILRQAEREADPVAEAVDESLLQADQERSLYNALQERGAEVAALFAGDRYAYTEVLTRLASLKEPVDHFFDQVMVRAEDPSLRANRLALLREITGLFETVADVSRLQG